MKVLSIIQLLTATQAVRVVSKTTVHGDECADSMYPNNSNTCWADDAYQKCDVDRQGAYDKIMKVGGSNMAALDLYNQMMHDPKCRKQESRRVVIEGVFTIDGQ